MLHFFSRLAVQPLTLGDFIINLLIALLCSLIQIGFYRLAYRGPGYAVSFLNSLVLLTMITALVIMVIGDSLARAFGLVGAMSIIRFRTAVKDVVDIVNVFFALAIGMAAGVGLHSAALTGSILLGTIYWLLVNLNMTSSEGTHYAAQFVCLPPDATGRTGEPAYQPCLRKYSRQSKLINVKSVGNADEVEISMLLKLNKNTSVSSLVQELKALPDVRSVMVFSDEEQF